MLILSKINIKSLYCTIPDCILKEHFSHESKQQHANTVNDNAPDRFFPSKSKTDSKGIKTLVVCSTLAYHGVPGMGLVATGLDFLATFSSSVISTSLGTYNQNQPITTKI